MLTTRDRQTAKTRWVFQDYDEPRKARARRTWAEAWPRLERLLSAFPADQRRLLLTVRRHGQPPHDEARAVLILPNGTLVAEESADDATTALKRTAQALAEEIKRHKEQRRREYLDRRKSRRREVLRAAGPLLRRDAELGRSAAFFELLRPLVHTLRDHVRRELRFAELQGTLRRGHVTEDDLIDEVLARAWRRFKEQPRWVSLDLWLLGLLHRVLGEWAAGAPVPSGTAPDRAADDEEWFASLFAEQETLEWEHLMLAHEGNPASRLEAEEEHERVLALLSTLPPVQRQVFALRVLEDYEAGEIAQIQGRSESEVLADIEGGRRALLARLKEAAGAAQPE